MSTKQNERRIRAKARLERQLKQGTKPVKTETVPLDESDKKRIAKEIEILSLKIK